MDRDQRAACISVLEAVMRFPVARIFWEPDEELNNPEVQYPLTLKMIVEKFERNIYVAPYEFILDMHQVFLNGSYYRHQKSIRPAAAQLLIGEFEKAVAKYLPFASEGSRKLHKFAEMLSTAPKLDVEEVYEELEPISTITVPAANDHERLAKIIRLLSQSPNVLKVFQIIYKLQPEVINASDGFSLQLSLLKEENLVIVVKMAIELLHKARQTVSSCLE